MLNSSDNEQINYGPAAITMDAGEKGVEVLFGTILTGEDVKNTPLQISEVEEHECILDEESKKATRRILVNNQIVNADYNKFKKIAENRSKKSKSNNNTKQANQDMEI